MLSFRKMLWAFALMAICVTIASAQVSPLQCTANAGVPPAARTEGLAEEVGQVVIICTGGTPTAAGALVPTVNIQVYLNTNITSKIMSDPWTEALLLIDEPAPAVQKVCGAANTDFDSNTGTCLVKAATSIGVGPANNPWALPGTYDGGTGHPNIWQARCTQSSCASSSTSSIVWLGVPVDPPGTSGQRVIRLTNIRANAAGSSLVSGTLLPSAIYMVISISGTGSLPVTQQSLTVAIVQPGMSFSVLGNPNFLQCNPQSSLCPSFRLRFQEMFGTAFRKIHTTGSPQTGMAILTSLDQNQPGTIYNTEGMFYGTNLPDLTGISRGNLGHSSSGAGRASQGTRLIARFTNVPLNVTLHVTARNVNPYYSGTTITGNNAVITLTNSDGSGAFTLPSFSSSLVTNQNCSTSAGGKDINAFAYQLYTVPLTSNGTVNSGQVVWEVLEADTGQIAPMDFGVTVIYGSSPLPNLGTATVTGNYAPLSTVNTMSSSAPVPRFLDNPQSSATFSINPCRTNLLFPFISNQAGYDTGISVANTSASPFESVAPRQTGKCTYYYYGSFSADPTRATFQQTTTSNVEPGTLALATLSGGGTHGLGAVAGFQGYLIVRCDFQYAHGFAYLSPAGAPLSGGATGYVALVMDTNTSTFPRTQNASESLGN